MPKIKIYRKKDWIMRFHLFEIHLDGQRIGYLSDRELSEFEVARGQHKLKVKTGAWGSKNFNFNLYTKEIMSFSVVRNKILGIIFTILILIISLRELYFVKSHMVKHSANIFILVFVSFIIIYLRIRRYSYLIIKEEGLKNYAD